MNIETFQRFVERIDPSLSKDEKKEKMIQIADSSHFTACYSNELTLIDCVQYEINIVNYKGSKIGILFCDLKKLTKRAFHPFLYTPFTSEFFREQTKIQEFWFVFVDEALNPIHEKFNAFIEEHKLKEYYSKIFLFRYLESNISQLN